MARKKLRAGDCVRVRSDFKIILPKSGYALVRAGSLSAGFVLGRYGLSVMVEFFDPVDHGHSGWEELRGTPGCCLLVSEDNLEYLPGLNKVNVVESRRILKLIRAGKFPEYSTDIRIVDIDGLLQLVRIDFIPIFNHDCIIEELETI